MLDNDEETAMQKIKRCRHFVEFLGPSTDRLRCCACGRIGYYAAGEVHWSKIFIHREDSSRKQTSDARDDNTARRSQTEGSSQNPEGNTVNAARQMSTCRA